MSSRNFNTDPYYVPVRIKLDITKPAKDSIVLIVPEMGNMVVWLHYEKIKRICTYCAHYFHNAEYCPLRNRRIISTSTTPGFGRHGRWMAQWIHIPMLEVDNQLRDLQGLSAPPSKALLSLKEAFAGITMWRSLAHIGRRPAVLGIIIPRGNLPPTSSAPTTDATNRTTQ